MSSSGNERSHQLPRECFSRPNAPIGVPRENNGNASYPAGAHHGAGRIFFRGQISDIESAS